MAARFSFGRNWRRYAAIVDEDRIRCAMAAMSASLGDLRGRTFLDIGCGSGIHVISAARLGASRIHAFDYDADSVECTRTLAGAHLPPKARASITIERGDALDERYMRAIGTFDVVYAWGVLHHTGNMWKALELATLPLSDTGTLLVALYNDQGAWSRGWKAMKAAYVRVPLLRPLILAGVFGPREIAKLIVKTPTRYIREWRSYRDKRGMSRWYDILDWAGGYPFEVASREAVREFYAMRQFSTTVTADCGGGNGCNEFRVARARDLSATCPLSVASSR
jgi:2-polyprenyl-6-hydroxyphenyl methylase/3-demethylubiquinone-9 3-methyltransferase